MNWCFWTAVLEKTLESPLDCKEIQPVHPKGNQSWIFIGKTDVAAEAPKLWPPDVKSWLIEKTLMLGKIEGGRRRGQQRMRLLECILKLCIFNPTPHFLWSDVTFYARLPCPSLTPRACSNSCPLNQWRHPTISSSAVLFSSCLQSFPASGSFLMS